MQILSRGGWLTDKHINAAQHLLASQYGTNGLQDTLSCITSGRGHLPPKTWFKFYTLGATGSVQFPTVCSYQIQVDL